MRDECRDLKQNVRSVRCSPRVLYPPDYLQIRLPAPMGEKTDLAVSLIRWPSSLPSHLEGRNLLAVSATPDYLVTLYARLWISEEFGVTVQAVALGGRCRAWR